MVLYITIKKVKINTEKIFNIGRGVGYSPPPSASNNLPSYTLLD